MFPGQRVILSLLLTLILAACINRIATEPPTTSIPLAPPRPETATPSVSMETTEAPTTALLPTTTPVALPTVTPEAVTPEDDGALVGPEWQMAYEGDLNQDGLRDAVAFKPAPVTPDSGMQQYLAEYPIVASEVLIVQESEGQVAQVQVMVNQREMRIDGQFAGAFGADTRWPGAFLLGVGPSRDVPVGIIPITAEGGGYAQGVGFYWHTAHQAYRLFVGGQKTIDLP